MFKHLKYLFYVLKRVLLSKYKWLVILFGVWQYRVGFMSDTGSGLGKLIQVITILGMLYLVLQYKGNVVQVAFQRTNMPTKSLLWIYVFGVVSTLWAFVPSFAFFLSFQNIVLAFLFIWFFGKCFTFNDMEKAFLIFMNLLLIYIFILIRVEGGGFIAHHLSSASCGALCFSYSIGEYLVTRKSEKNRRRLLLNSIILSLIVLITSTSSGANLSAAFGFTMALFLSGNFLYTILLLIFTVFLYLNQDSAEELLYMLMPGKSRGTVDSVSGREELWNIILELARQKPLTGWGFACVERVATHNGFDAADAHSNYYGMYGSLGLIGLLMLIIHLVSSAFYAFKRRMRPGYVGIFCAVCSGILNGYTYGFLSGKASGITVIWIALTVLSYMYLKVPYGQVNKR